MKEYKRKESKMGGLRNVHIRHGVLWQFANWIERITFTTPCFSDSARLFCGHFVVQIVTFSKIWVWVLSGSGLELSTLATGCASLLPSAQVTGTEFRP